MLDPSGSSVQVTHNLCNYLAEQGCQVDVFTGPHWRRAEKTSPVVRYQSHVTFYKRTQLRSYAARGFPNRLFWKMMRLGSHAWSMLRIWLLARRFDVVHVQFLPLPVFDYLCLRFISGRAPVVCTVHEVVPHDARFRRMSAFVFRAIYRHARILFAHTEATQTKLIHDYGIDPSRIVRIEHGNLEHLLDPTVQYNGNSRSHPLTILFLGQIRRDKGLDVLVEAAAMLRQRVPAFRLQIVGAPGFDLSSIRRQIQERGLEDLVEFHLAYVSDPEFAKYLMNATVVALPYRRIEQSGVAVAACTLGKAIVATRCGGLQEMVEQAGNGLLVPIDDACALAEALETVLTDPEKRSFFEASSTRYAQTVLSWKPIAEKTVSGYRAAINQM